MTETVTFVTLATDVFDCHAGEAQWRLWWSSDKRSWCCANKGVGCAAPKTVKVGALPIMKFGVPGDQQHWHDEEEQQQKRTFQHIRPHFAVPAAVALLTGTAFVGAWWRRGIVGNQDLGTECQALARAEEAIASQE